MNEDKFINYADVVMLSIAKLCDLSISENIHVRLDRHYHPKRVQAIINSGLINPEMTREFRHFEGYVEPNELKENAPLDSDILGEYDSKSHSIVIYEIPCKLASWGLSRALGRTPSDDLLKVVMAHEIGHAVTHIGIDNRGSIWENFSIASRDDKELFAQIFALKCLEMRNENSAVQVFRELATKQSDVYNTWKGIYNESIKEIDELLLEARRKEPYEGRENDGAWNGIKKNDIAGIIPELLDLLAKEELKISSFELGRNGPHSSHLEKVLRGVTKLPPYASVNVIPSPDPGLCTPILIILMKGTIRDFKRRLEEASEFVNNICKTIQQIIIWTPLWHSRTWREMSPKFEGQTLSIKIFGLDGQTIQSIGYPQMKLNVISSGSSIIEEICERCGRKSPLHKVEVRWRAQGFALDGGYIEWLCNGCSDKLINEIRKGNVFAMNSIDLPCKEISIDGKKVDV